MPWSVLFSDPGKKRSRIMAINSSPVVRRSLIRLLLEYVSGFPYMTPTILLILWYPHAQNVCTGCPAVGVSTLILNISGRDQPILKPLESVKVLTGRICLAYEMSWYLILIPRKWVVNFSQIMGFFLNFCNNTNSEVKVGTFFTKRFFSHANLESNTSDKLWIWPFECQITPKY